MKRLLFILGLAACVATAGALAADGDPLAAAGDAVAVAAETVAAAADAATEEAPSFASYEDFQKSPAFAQFVVDNLWILIAAALVFIMHAGFATVESGLTQAKNTVNILFKNVFIICMGVLAYAVWGFNSMYPGDSWTISGIFAMGSPIAGGFAEGAESVANLTNEYAAYTYWSDFIFQAMFAATAATIISGAVAERIKLSSFMLAATIVVLVGYPITGSWEWGGGWLNSGLDGMFGAEFIDFAGSSLVHAFGGYAALAAVLLLGPRRGKYAGGKIKPILGHSMPLAAIGVFLLFLGWFGFNGGSVLSADPAGVSFVFVTTTIAGCAGGLAAAFTSWGVLKKPDLSMALNGILAGLVGITAGADTIKSALWGSVAVGAIAGVLVVLSVLLLDKLKIDDPVGAISVHGVCGNWGTIAVGIFGGGGFLSQLVGTLAVSAFAFTFSLLVFGIIKAVMGLRVSEEEEFEGLDVGEHGMPAYPYFQPVAER
ncbi:MAG: ammonium transporter [Verrucomicrobiales bacterium]|nr:ammonium transporter [Verrucomicrobiales bacterium]